MILTYKLLNGKEGIKYNKFFKLNDGPYDTRGHNMKLDKPRQNGEVKKYTFSYRVVNDWNGLTPEEVNATSTGEFKREYDEHEEERKQRIASAIYTER